MSIYSFAELDLLQNKKVDLGFTLSKLLEAFPRLMMTERKNYKNKRVIAEIYQKMTEDVGEKTIEEIIDLTVEYCDPYEACSENCLSMMKFDNPCGYDTFNLKKSEFKDRFRFIQELKEWLLLRYFYKQESGNKAKTFKKILSSADLNEDARVAFSKMRSNCGSRIKESVQEQREKNPPRIYRDARSFLFKRFGGMMSGTGLGQKSERKRDPSIQFMSKYDLAIAAMFLGNKIMWNEEEGIFCLLGKKYIHTLDLRNLLRKDISDNYIKPFVNGNKDRAIMSYMIERVTLRNYIDAIGGQLSNRERTSEEEFIKNIGPVFRYFLEYNKELKASEEVLLGIYKQKPWLFVAYLLAAHPLIGFRAEVARNLDLFSDDTGVRINRPNTNDIPMFCCGDLCGILAHQIFLYFPLVISVFDFLVKLREANGDMPIKETVSALDILSGEDYFKDDLESPDWDEATERKYAQDISVNFLKLVDLMVSRKTSYLDNLINTDFNQEDTSNFPEVWHFINQNFEELRDLYGIARNDNRTIYYIEKVDNIRMPGWPQKKGFVD